MNKIANMHVASSTAGSLSRRSLFKLGGSLQPSLPELRWPGARLSRRARLWPIPARARRALPDGTPSFLIAPEPITEFDETRDFEVVVVGAGVSGMAAAMSAAEAGAKIACVQREATPSSQGNMARWRRFEPDERSRQASPYQLSHQVGRPPQQPRSSGRPGPTTPSRRCPGSARPRPPAASR